ncbi:DUF6024 family protein [Pantoea sp. KPR_PJ]|uniref:DUF6024 family protein n=1 Tax=Pantoea sp. KPR_PJ TaxID=2738375 RepID=UPI003529C980
MALPPYADRPAQARDRLRTLLSRHYRLEHYDLFFAPSLHVARILLSQLFLRQEQARNQTRYASHYPVTELNVLPAVPLMAGSINFVPHVELPWGLVHSLVDCQQQGVVDVSESFASNLLHDDVINHSSLFVTCLDRHVDLPGGLVLVALRTADFSTLVRSELRLFEQGLPLDTSVFAALARAREADWRPFNQASVEAIALHSPLLLASSHQPGLPFASFPLSQTQLAALTPASDLELWPRQGRLLIRASHRGSGKKRSTLTAKVSLRLQQLFITGGQSEKRG